MSSTEKNSPQYLESGYARLPNIQISRPIGKSFTRLTGLRAKYISYGVGVNAATKEEICSVLL